MKNEKIIHFAFAVYHAGQFEAKHFGDAVEYLIYHWDHAELVYINEMLNPFKAHDEEQAHGSQKKGMAIVEGLKNRGVKP